MQLVYAIISIDSGTDNCAIGFGGLMVLLDDQFDPWRFSSSVSISQCRKPQIKDCKNIRIDVVSPVGSACLHHWSRVQVVGTHTVDNEPRLLGKLIELSRIQLNDQDIYAKPVSLDT